MIALIDNEVRQLRDNLGALALLLLTILLLVGLTDQLWRGPSPLRVAIVDAGNDDDPKFGCGNDELLTTLIRDEPDLRLKVRLPKVVFLSGVWRTIDSNHLDMLLVCDPEPAVPGGRRMNWIAYTSARNDTDTARMTMALRLLTVGLASGEPWYLAQMSHAATPTPDATTAKPSATTAETPVIAFHPRGALTGAGSAWLLPGVSMMVSLVLTFYFAAGAIVREADAGTWDSLRLSPTATVPRILLSKSVLPMAVGFVSLSVCAVAGALFGLSVKPEIGVLAVVVYLPALFATTMQGLLISSLVRVTSGALFCAAAYLVSMFMFSGLFVPLDWSGPAVRVVSFLFPLSYALEPTSAVLLHGAGIWWFGEKIIGALILGAVFAALASAILAYRWRRFV